MHLTREEERILNGEEGEAKELALRIIVKVGEALGAERLVDIKHAHVSGVSYGTIGDHGLHFLEELASKGARVAVPASVNPVGFDLDDPQLLEHVGVRLSGEFVSKQVRIVRALKSMGVRATLTCTPYYVDEVFDDVDLKPGDHVAWGESSAILYANTVLGLRTNREGGPLALMAAIAGKTYYWGLHLDENRVPVVGYRVPLENLDEAKAGVLGELIATRHNESHPPYVAARAMGELGIREFLAALGAAGSIAMVVLEGVTPEYKVLGESVEEWRVVSEEEINDRLEELAPTQLPEVVFIGCPHAAAEDLERLAELLSRMKGKPKSKIVVTLSRRVFEKTDKSVISKLREAGVLIVRDTCLIVSPFGRSDKVSVATNSYKAYFYLSKRGLPVGLAPLEELVYLAYGG